MLPFNRVLADPQRSPEMAAQQRWIERFVCGTMPAQRVVSNRIDHFSGLPVSQQQFNSGDKVAQVCPFVRDSIDKDLFFLEESVLTHTDGRAIQALLISQIDPFFRTPPAYDPRTNGGPACVPCIWKTFMTVFPDVLHTQGNLPLFDQIHQALKPRFVQAGLMLGQFYSGCPQEAIYNPAWKQTLSSPYPAFAIRYLVQHDRLFTQHDPALYSLYKTYFP